MNESIRNIVDECRVIWVRHVDYLAAADWQNATARTSPTATRSAGCTRVNVGGAHVGDFSSGLPTPVRARLRLRAADPSQIARKSALREGSTRSTAANTLSLPERAF